MKKKVKKYVQYYLGKYKQPEQVHRPRRDYKEDSDDEDSDDEQETAMPGGTGSDLMAKNDRDAAIQFDDKAAIAPNSKLAQILGRRR